MSWPGAFCAVGDVLLPEGAIRMKRVTRQRTEILRVIDEAQRPLSPQEILEAGRAAIPSLSIATIYRNLRDLQQDGMIQAVALPGDSPRYESLHAHAHHHHHFQCTRCQKVFDIHGCPGSLQGMEVPPVLLRSPWGSAEVQMKKGDTPMFWKD